MFKVWLTVIATVMATIAGIIGLILGQYAAGAGLIMLAGVFGVGVWLSLAHQFRTVVAPNEVHTVQGGTGKVSYGSAKAVAQTINPDNIALDGDVLADVELPAFVGNSYYKWPEWWPKVGVTVVEMPLSVFSLELERYVAYDQNRVPFVVDIMAFFRVAMPDIASERIDDFDELKAQLRSILQGAARTLLASYTIEDIMMERQVFGERFTHEVAEQLKEWGVITVKNIELMDIRDPHGEGESRVITNIQAKEQSRIERESREVVADNVKQAEIAETIAKRDSDVAREQALQQVGEREAEKIKAVGIANEKAQQEIKEQARETAEKDMAIKKVEEVRQAEITKDVQVVKATEDREVSIVKAEGDQQEMIIKAEGVKQDIALKSEGELTAERNKAIGIEVVGAADAEAKRLLNMADVDPELVLAREIGENDGYQNYLNTEKAINANRDVGVAAASALEKGDLKVIVNGGSTNEGVNSLMSLFDGSNGGTQLGAIIDGALNTEGGAALLQRLGVTKTPSSPTPDDEDNSRVA